MVPDCDLLAINFKTEQTHVPFSRHMKNLLLSACAVLWTQAALTASDHLRDLQDAAVKAGSAKWGYWGARPDMYADWTTHSNRLVPVYSYGISLDQVDGANSVYRSPSRLTRVFGQVPSGTLNPEAAYFDQTDIYRLQVNASLAGKKYIFLVIFDGMDWHTTRAAAYVKSGGKGYSAGRGQGLAFQDYRGMETDYGFMVTSPHNDSTMKDVNRQLATLADVTPKGGYHPILGGDTPWARPGDINYLKGKHARWGHLYTDSAASGTAMTSGVKTFIRSVNLDREGLPVTPIGRRLQQERGFSVGIVTSVPISHATPAVAYAQNVMRYDTQDIARDLLGLPSASHPDSPLKGVDVLIGAGWGHAVETDEDQGENFVPGNPYITDADIAEADKGNGGPYTVVLREAGKDGRVSLSEAAATAASENTRLFGFFGTRYEHLPFQTADGNYNPTDDSTDRREREEYTKEDLLENPRLVDMVRAALKVLEANEKGFWMMVEAGDVDWASHGNNIDNVVGAIHSGDDAFRAIVEWAEKGNHLDETAIIVTSDHGHLLTIRDLKALLPAK